MQILDDALARYEGQDNHLLLGLLHKARAEVAFKLSDRARVEQELSAMEKQFARRAIPPPSLNGSGSASVSCEQDDEVGRTVTVNTDEVPFAASHQTLVLTTRFDGVNVPVGGLIVERSAQFNPLDDSFAEAIAQGLDDLMIKTATNF